MTFNTKWEVYRFNGRDFILFDIEGSMTAHFTLMDFEKVDIGELNEPKVIVDIGANIGIFSFCMADKYPSALVCAYEPNEHNFKHLMLGAQKNELSNIEAIPMGVSNSKEIDLYMDLTNSGATSAHSLPLFERYDAKYHKTTAPCVTLKSITDRFDYIDFMKIDIECEEYNLTDTWDELDKVGGLFIEMHANPGDETHSDKARKAYTQISNKMKGKTLICKMGDEALAKELGLSWP